jgi:hypothetical protein
MKFDIVDGILVIRIPVSKQARETATPSKSGKMKLLATSNGFTSVSTPDGTVRVSLNVGF